jgi:type I restriction enzyme R subunit
MASGTREIHVEEHIEQHLVKVHEYRAVPASAYHKEWCLLPDEFIAFIKTTQPKAYSKLQEQYGTKTDEQLCRNLNRYIIKFGTLQTLRDVHGYKDMGELLHLIYFKPVNDKNPEHLALYNQNRFAVVRQVKYSAKNENSIDLVIFVNGIPLFTAELKNALTGQYISQAIRQYRDDRDSKEPLLAYKRCLAHFAVSTEEVKVTTRLAGESTFFLPFNQDIKNPVNEQTGFSTAYLWEDVWSRESVLDLVQNYIHAQTDTEVYYDKASKEVKERKKEKAIFPRYHQRRAVYRLLNALQRDGSGGRYLVQHSAGSGKTNTISWLAHRLSGFYRHAADEHRMFNSVIVVSDRRVLDKQLQDNILQFQQKDGVVAVIDETKTSQDLKRAIEAGKSIIVTTIQKFPVISESVRGMKDRKFAVIIDEAHSSQTGESAKHLRKALSLEQAAKEEETEEKEQQKTLEALVEEEIEKTGRQPNISYFAFTATPKNKTLEIFCEPVDGKLQAFDEYTMDQAIAEGFILDVLSSYTTFKRYYKLAKDPLVDDKEYEKRKTVRLLSSYVDVHDNAIDTKSRIMLEHFISKTQNEIQGEARAMVVTRSRLHAVRYKRKFDELMREMNAPYKALVAFSGTVYDPETDSEYTETNMNNLGGKISIQRALKLPQYRLLIVANKFQTGFDEPRLHTMFVDKKLGGVNTVQTLSRLNRTMSGKTGTMVLDFVNDIDLVREDFQRYFKSVFMPEDKQTDPNSLYMLLTTLKGARVFFSEEVNELVEVFLKKENNLETMQPLLTWAVARYEQLEEEEQQSFKTGAGDFVKLYRFLSQIISFKDQDLFKHYIYLGFLLKKLPYQPDELPREVLNEVELVEYRVQMEHESKLSLVSENAELYGLQPGGGSKPLDEEFDFLTNIIKTLNETFGLNLSEDDRKDLQSIREKIDTNALLLEIFNPTNSKANIEEKFKEEIDNQLLYLVNQKLELFNKLTQEKANEALKRMWFNQLYDKRVRGI